jgi:serine/threonine-protein kinase ULK/ATG1
MLKVADFGFARSLPAAALAETLCGSPLYMAPEILRYEKYDAKADLWSVGAVLFEMAVGKPPFKANNHVELLKKIERNDDKIRFPDEEPSSRDEMEDYSDLVNAPPVASDIKDLIRKLLKKKPVMRMGFNEFFDCTIWAGCMKQPRKSSHHAYADVISPRAQSRRPSSGSTNVANQRSVEEQVPRPSAAQPRATHVPVAPQKSADHRYRPTATPALSRDRSAPDLTNEAVSPRALPRDIKTETTRATTADQIRQSRSGSNSNDKQSSAPIQRDRDRERSFSSSSHRQTPEIRTPNSHDVASNRHMSSMAREDNPSRSTAEEADGNRRIQDSDEYVVVEKRNVEVNVLADGKL